MRTRWRALISAFAALAATTMTTPAHRADAAPPLFACSGSPRDFNVDKKADVYGFDRSARIWLMRGTGSASAPFSHRIAAQDQGTWDHHDNFTYVGRTRNWPCAVYARDTTNGTLEAFEPDRYGRVHAFWSSINMRAYSMFTGVGDLTGSGYGDMLARDKAGALWLFRGENGPDYWDVFKPPLRVPGTWKSVTALVGAGDVTGDGRPDLLARDGTGVLRLYPGTGQATKPFGPAVRLGGDWKWATAFIGAGDYTGDGRPDLLARDGTGRVWLSPGRLSSAAPFGGRTVVGTGWGAYTFLF
ncbi:FG-GAP repeat domain-containing protein [Streptomyces sp. NPDC001852]|uniref:FG-GAP repeat domain-containing protein n=1 Tax=Streptomyces sp. NPDC001852 TaxID=3364619 RepID=UPI0036BAE777